MSGDPIGDDVRKLRRARRLGTAAICVLCGESNPVELVKVGRSLLDEHHLAGHVNDLALVVVVCRNCHARLSEAQRDSGVELQVSEGRTSLERLEAVLRGLADFFLELAHAFARWADELAHLVRHLDEGWPGWRGGEG